VFGTSSGTLETGLLQRQDSCKNFHGEYLQIISMYLIYSTWGVSGTVSKAFLSQTWSITRIQFSTVWDLLVCEAELRLVGFFYEFRPVTSNVNDELQSILNNAFPVLSRYYTGICLEGLRKNTKNSNQDSQCCNPDTSREPPGYKCSALKYVR
jgi:hypothetical protein